MNFEKMTPVELGETKEKGAIPYLIIYIKNGNDNEKRLAASAVNKLIPYHKNVCRKAIPFLIENLQNPKPQVRHYTLKVLREFDLSDDYYQAILHIARHDEKYYNQNMANEILQCFDKYNPNDASAAAESESSEEPVGKGFVYFIQEDFSDRVKIGKTENLEQRMETFGVKLPFQIKLIHSIVSENHNYTEKLFHIHFSDRHTNGEWFELSDKDIQWIKSGQYTKRIMDSIVKAPKQTFVTRNVTVKATDKQKTFLETLLIEKKKELLCSVDELSVEEASDLISYFYKGIEPSGEIKHLVADFTRRDIG